MIKGRVNSYREALVPLDGSTVEFDIHEATLIWDGRSRRIPVDAADVTPLLGMGLLYGHVLTIEIIENGNSLIQPLKVS